MTAESAGAPRAAARRRSARIALAAAGFAVFGFLLWLALPALSSDDLRAWVEGFGAWGPVALGGYLVLSHIVAPLSGIPALVVGASVFGLPRALAYLYAASIVSAAVNFALSRRFGRPLIRRLAGVRALAAIDEFARETGAVFLVAARAFGNAVFEEISYAAGLTAMPFRRYIALTALGTVVPYAAVWIFFRNADLSAFSSMALLIGSLIAVAALFGVFLRAHARRKRNAGRGV